jgi:hypothetical protein
LLIIVVGEGLLVRAQLFTISGSGEILLNVLTVQQADLTELGPDVLCYVLCRFSAGLLYAALLLGPVLEAAPAVISRPAVGPTAGAAAVVHSGWSDLLCFGGEQLVLAALAAAALVASILLVLLGCGWYCLGVVEVGESSSSAVCGQQLYCCQCITAK